MMTVRNRKYLVVVAGLTLLAGMAEAARASCDVKRVCELVGIEKQKIKNEKRSSDDDESQRSADTEELREPSDTDEARESPDSSEKQLFEAARDEILNECGYKMDESENRCRLERVIKLCWNEKKAQLKKCRE